MKLKRAIIAGFIDGIIGGMLGSLIIYLTLE